MRIPDPNKFWLLLRVWECHLTDAQFSTVAVIEGQLSATDNIIGYYMANAWRLKCTAAGIDPRGQALDSCSRHRPSLRHHHAQLINGPKDVTTLANAVDISLVRVSQNLGVLRALNLVRGRRVGQRRIYRLHESWRIVRHDGCIFISTSHEPTVQLCLASLSR